MYFSKWIQKLKCKEKDRKHVPNHDRQTFAYHQKGLSENICVCVCSWVTPDTKITRCAKQLVDVDSMLFQGPPQRELCKMGEKSFMLHSGR